MKWDIINKLIKDHGFSHYLEIGFKDGNNFDRIKVQSKQAVDPAPELEAEYIHVMTSDAFFDQNKETFDLVFVDGLHEAHQVRRDMINASKCLSENGCIVLHDMCPTSKEMQEVPRKVKHWTGDCWRVMVGFRKKYPEIVAYTHDRDYGVGVIWPRGRKFAGKFEDMDMSYEQFKSDRVTLLGIIND